VIALTEVIAQFEAAFVQQYGARLLPSQQQAMAALKRCRTRFAPRMLAACTACGEQRSVPHSCGHRSCPHCQHHESQVWLQRQLAALVPASYFMLTFTLPAELRGLAWTHQRVVYALLMQCACGLSPDSNSPEDCLCLAKARGLRPRARSTPSATTTPSWVPAPPPRPARWACCTPTTGAWISTPMCTW